MRADGGSPLILLVDQDADTRDILRAVLETRGYQVMEAADGTTGARLAHDHRPAVIIGDFPVDGWGTSSFVGAVRHNPALATTWLLTLTAHAFDSEVREARRISDAVLVKPVEPTEVAAEVERLLAHGERRAGPPLPASQGEPDDGRARREARPEGGGYPA